MKLFYSPGACSLSPHIALAESGLPYQFEKVNLRAEPRLTESAALVQDIADQAPEKNLAPANGTLARYRLQEALNFISTEVHKGFSPLFYSQDDAVKEAAWQRLSTRFDALNATLGQQDYLLGDSYTVADGYLFVCLSWTKYVGRTLDAWPALQAFSARIFARPAVQQAMKEEGLL